MRLSCTYTQTGLAFAEDQHAVGGLGPGGKQESFRVDICAETAGGIITVSTPAWDGHPAIRGIWSAASGAVKAFRLRPSQASSLQSFTVPTASARSLLTDLLTTAVD